MSCDKVSAFKARSCKVELAFIPERILTIVNCPEVSRRVLEIGLQVSSAAFEEIIFFVLRDRHGMINDLLTGLDQVHSKTQRVEELFVAFGIPEVIHNY
jgi:hypothetical protein